jgi:transcription initiation factor TFIIIB Brf1 subunit/transcription initiation factor TFIIB
MVTDIQSAEVACESCGLVSADNANENPARSVTFESDKGSSNNNNNNNNNIYQRVSLSNSLAFHDMGLSTIIGGQNRDSAGIWEMSL